MTNPSVSENAVKVKICGITCLKDAFIATEAGADFLGLIFVPNTPRCLDAEKAAMIVINVREAATQTESGKPCPKLVGVFRNQSLDEILTIVENVPLDLIQLHGGESDDFIAQLPLPVIRFVPLTETLDAPPQGLRNQTYLMEPPKGSGIGLLDWLKNSAAENSGKLETLASWANTIPLLLAGGLTPDNISAVLTTLSTHNACPRAVDVASGVESEPGVKAPDAVRDFCQIAHGFMSSFEDVTAL